MHPRPRTLRPDSLGDHHDRLVRVARSLTRSAADADDLVQETYARLLARPRRIRGDDAGGYLVAALHNTFVSGHRRDRRAPALVGADAAERLPDADADRSPDAVVRTREVLEAVRELPPALRAAITAVDLVGLAPEEAAHGLGVPAGTVRRDLVRGRIAVARRLGLERR